MRALRATQTRQPAGGVCSATTQRFAVLYTASDYGNIVNGAPARVRNVSHPPLFVGTPSGRAVAMGGTANASGLIMAAAAPAAGVVGSSFLWHGLITQQDATHKRVFSRINSTALNANYAGSFSLFINASGFLGIDLHIGASGVQVATSSLAATVNTPITVLATFTATGCDLITSVGNESLAITGVPTSPGSLVAPDFYIGASGDAFNAHRYTRTLAVAGSVTPLSSDLVRNPWQLFQGPSRLGWAFPVDSVTIYRPSSDIAVTGWTATGAASVAAAIGETVASDTEYGTSPDLSTNATISLTASMPAGTYNVRVRSAYVGASGQVRVRFLNASNVDQGGTSWQVLTGSATTYTLSATTTGTADRFRIEVQ